VDFVTLDRANQRVFGVEEIKWSDRVADNPSRELAGLIWFCIQNKRKTAFVHTRTVERLIETPEVTLHFYPLAWSCLALAETLVAQALDKGRHPRSFMRLFDEIAADSSAAPEQ
jgi:hypothetical protein